MTSFVWKRKASSVQKTDKKVTAFDNSEQIEDDNDNEDFDWISIAKRRI